MVATQKILAETKRDIRLALYKVIFLILNSYLGGHCFEPQENSTHLVQQSEQNINSSDIITALKEQIIQAVACS